MTSHDAMIQTMSHLSAFCKAAAKVLLFFETTKQNHIFVYLLMNFKWETAYQFAIHKEISVVYTRL